MIRLDSTLKKLQVVLNAAPATAQLSIVACWSDKTAFSYNGSQSSILTNGTAAVDVVAAPSAASVRDIDYITIFNSDTAVAVVTVIYNNNSVLSTVVKVTLPIGSTLKYTHANSWAVIDSQGGQASSPPNLTGPISSSGGVTTITAQTGTGTTFVMSQSPTLVTPNIGNATAGTFVAGGSCSLGGAIGAESLRVVPIASAINRFVINGCAAGGSINNYCDGLDTQIPLAISSKGAGAITFYSSIFANIQLRIRCDFASINYLEIFGSTTGNSLLLRAEGVDANVGASIFSKGNGTLVFGYNQGVNGYLSLSTLRSAFTQIVNIPVFTVALLPAGILGDRATVSDAVAPTFLTALTGGGAIKTPVFHNGTIWVAG